MPKEWKELDEALITINNNIIINFIVTVMLFVMCIFSCGITCETFVVQKEIKRKLIQIEVSQDSTLKILNELEDRAQSMTTDRLDR